MFDCIRKVILFDLDAVFASVEQRDDPSPRKQPMAVGHATRRGVFAAASYKARRFGVHSALSSVTAMRRCPNLVLVPLWFYDFAELASVPASGGDHLPILAKDIAA